jgi:hypothetical protein
MFDGNFNDDIWDEHRWEAHLNELEQKNIHLSKFINPESSDQTPRWLALLRKNTDELDAVDAFIEEELQLDDSYFPDEEDEDFFEEDEWEDYDDFLFDDFEEDEFFTDEYEDDNEGEEWKSLSEDFAMSEFGSIETLQIYNDSRSFAAHILQWAESIHPGNLTTDHHDFISNVLKIGAKIAGGYSFGFETDFLGANIVYTKKALYCANDALTLLERDLKETPFLYGNQYFDFHEQLFTLRNNIGIYIQELRELFYNSL